MQNVCVCLCVCGPAVLAHLARMRYHDSHARTLSTIQQPISIASPLLGRLICIFTLPLKNHNAMSPGCILGARRVYRRCPVSSRYTWNIGVEHVDKLSGPPSLFLPHSLVFSVPPHPPLSFPTSTRTSVFFPAQSAHKRGHFAHIRGSDGLDPAEASDARGLCALRHVCLCVSVSAPR